jgi:hypothetical protein
MQETKTPPLVGQFSGPPGNAARSPVDLPRKPAPAATPEGAEKLEDALKASAAEKAEKKQDDAPRIKTPQEKAADYKAGLQEVGVSEMEARGILEKVLIHGVYEEKQKIGPVEVTVRTRNYEDALRAMRYLELEKPTYAMGINDVVARYNMAASLSSFGEKLFEHPRKQDGATNDVVENAFDVRMSFIVGLPTVAFDRLQQIMHTFDGKISAVFAEGAPEDF